MSIGFKTTGLNTSTPNLALERLLFSSPVEQNYQLKTGNAANCPSSAVSRRHSDCDTLATLLLFFFFEGPQIQCTCIILFLSVLPRSTSIKPQPNRVRKLVLYKDTEIPPGDNGVVLYFIGRWEEEGGGEVRRGLHMRSKERLQQLVKENRLCFCGVRLNLAGTSCG